MPTQFSQSATEPVMTMERSAGHSMWAPILWWVRSHGSSGAPSGRVQVMNRPIGVNG